MIRTGEYCGAVPVLNNFQLFTCRLPASALLSDVSNVKNVFFLTIVHQFKLSYTNAFTKHTILDCDCKSISIVNLMVYD